MILKKVQLKDVKAGDHWTSGGYLSAESLNTMTEECRTMVRWLDLGDRDAWVAVPELVPAPILTAVTDKYGRTWEPVPYSLLPVGYYYLKHEPNWYTDITNDALIVGSADSMVRVKQALGHDCFCTLKRSRINSTVAQDQIVYKLTGAKCPTISVTTVQEVRLNGHHYEALCIRPNQWCPLCMVTGNVDFTSYVYKDGHESTILEKANEVTGVRFNVSK